MSLKLFKRGVTYWIGGTIGDHAVRQTLSTRSRSVAFRRAHELELRFDAGIVATPWKELRKRFLAIYFGGRTADGYTVLLTALERTFPLKYPHEVTLLDLEHFTQRTIRKPNTIRLEISQLRCLWRWAHRRKIVFANFAQDLRMPQCELAATLPFTPSELVAIEKAIRDLAEMPCLVAQGTAKTIHDRTWALYQLMRTTGIRVSDLIRLRPENIVDDHLVFHTQKTKAPVRVVVVDATRAAIQALVVRTSGYYFWSGRSAQICAAGVNRTFRSIGRHAGVRNVRPHRFRHTFAVTLLATGADIRLVSRMLGHRTIRATERHYSPWIKVFQDQADAAVLAAERFSIERRQSGKMADRDFQAVEIEQRLTEFASAKGSMK